MSEMLVLSAADVRRALPMAEAIEGMKAAYQQVSTGLADLPLRTSVPIAERDGAAVFMPVYLSATGDLAVKVVTIFPGNVDHGRPLVQGTVQVFDDTTGEPRALVDGGELTAIRTAAGGGASVDVLARPEAQVLAVLGSGIQARTGVEAACTVRPIDEVRVYSPDADHRERFAAEIRGRGPVPDRVVAVDTPGDAVTGADIVYTATTSTTPTFDGADLAPGAHVVGVGSFTPEMVEMDAVTIERALVVVDQRSACWAEAGELIAARDRLPGGDVHAELGEILAGHRPGRTSADQITLFKSVGLAAQDAAAARIAVDNARAAGVGTTVTL